MPASKKPTAKQAAKAKPAAAKKPQAAVKAKAAEKPAAKTAEPQTVEAAAPVASKPAKAPVAHGGKPEQPLWQRFNQNHSQKMSKGRSFRHQGR